MKPITVDINSAKRLKSHKVRGFGKKALDSGYNKKKEFDKKKLFQLGKKGLLVFACLLVVLIPLIYRYLYSPAMSLKDSAYKLMNAVKVAKEHVDMQDLTKVESDVSIISGALDETESKYQYFSFVKNIPFVGGYYKNGEYIFNAAKGSVPVAEDLIAAGMPIADVFGYKTSSGEHEEVGGQEKIETIIRNMPDISSVIAQMRPQIEQILDELNKIDPDYIPEEINGYKLNEIFEGAASVIVEGREILSDVESLLSMIPDAAGVTEPRTYLILFQNDMEIRPTGGFITAYGYATVDNGRLGDVESEDIYNLDALIYSYDRAPIEIQQYLGQTEWHLRDSNLHADLVSSTQRFEDIYQNQYSPRPFEGIVYLDTQFVESLLKVTGPIEMTQYGTTISDENVVYELEVYSEKIFTGGEDRKQFMEDLMGELVERLLESGGEQWGDLFSAVWGGLKSKHLMLNFHNEELQDLASEYGFAGEIETEWDGDYFHINEANMGGLKSNMYVRSSVQQDIEINKSGDIVKTVKIHWENPEPADHWLNGLYRCWVRIYVPYGAELLSDTVDVREMNSEWDELDYGKTVFDKFITVPTAEAEDSGPGTYDLEFSYTIPKDIVEDDLYPLLIQKQAGKPVEQYSITINGQLQTYDLDKDTTIEFQL